MVMHFPQRGEPEYYPMKEIGRSDSSSKVEYGSEHIMKRRDSKECGEEGESVILVHKDIQGEDEYITWIENREGDRFWGHYFVDKSEAEDDYTSR